MDDTLRDLLQTWTDAEKARRDYAADYFAAGWVDGLREVDGPAKALDEAALEGFRRHDAAVRTAREAYEAQGRLR